MICFLWQNILPKYAPPRRGKYKVNWRGGEAAPPFLGISGPSRRRDGETERQRDRETERQRDRETERQRDREKNKERKRDKKRKIERENNSWTWDNTRTRKKEILENLLT